MRKTDKSRKGLAAVEFALMLPAVALLFLLLVEGANAMHAYSNLVEASREGARLALMDGETSDIEALVKAVTDELDPQFLSTSVSTDAGQNTVTVEVAYDYQPFGEDALEMLTGQQTLQIVAQTTMPLP
ncbi:pilus assembly protein [Pseudodesulfovibrio cashew]|uniref:Pilus assembly protein n=1 Tax=Pseudodesulfovibrio cashew TaxID=2678688 RepID=A0A6I6JEJ1_9BACT|nr:TadE/TadG family type IV pilus assembly protein [Pseudodesulfovibrio cashew]QGY38842.1 pilus assembly protein [Pseudodesulfovibrio cashew]